MYKVLVRPVLTYASETWTPSKTDERLYELFKESDIVKYIKINRLGRTCYTYG
jgi:hypothetical protein